MAVYCELDMGLSCWEEAAAAAEEEEEENNNKDQSDQMLDFKNCLNISQKMPK